MAWGRCDHCDIKLTPIDFDAMREDNELAGGAWNLDDEDDGPDDLLCARCLDRQNEERWLNSYDAGGGYEGPRYAGKMR